MISEILSCATVATFMLTLAYALLTVYSHLEYLHYSEHPEIYSEQQRVIADAYLQKHTWIIFGGATITIIMLVLSVAFN